MDTRKEIHDILTRNAGVFVKDLKVDRDGQVTHLLCGSARGSDVDERGWTQKMRLAESHNAKSSSTVKVALVWEEWFWDCLEFGGASNFQ